MEKQNDYFLNLLSNPTFSADDFSLVGLSIDNTSILDKNIYLKSDYIKNQPIFLTNGYFDLNKFDNFYEYAKFGFTNLSKIKESEDLGNTWKAYRNDITMPEYLRDTEPQFKILKVANPLRQLSGFVNFGLKENPTLSIREIALTQLVYNPETGEWGESPNETWFDNFLHPKVLATWDSDGEHKDPITGEKVKHKKGERKLNSNGTFYYEKLGNRSVYGKEVLSGFDTLTTDGSFWNKLDFLDSDDIEKSFGGTLMRTAAQIVPAFIPGVNTWYIGSRVALGLSLVLPSVGKTLESITGTTLGGSLFNNLEAWNKALTFSLSDYVLGSLLDDGTKLSDAHLWSLETGLKLVADVFTQLAELRWMFDKASTVFSGLSKEVVSTKEGQTKWIEDYISKNTRPESIDKILTDGLSKGIDPRLRLATMQNVEWLRALNVLNDKLKGALELGSKISMAYMTGITTADAYGEAKQAGATDLEAALFTLGYTFGEWKLLNSEVGKWILPELKAERKHMENAITKSMPAIKEAVKEAETRTDIGKAKLYSKLFNIGKKAWNNRLGEGVGSEALGATISNMASEAIEETSEELLLDVSKTLFNAASSLVGSGAKFDDAFENIFDRYALSFLGGAVGGGIAGYLPAYRQARFDKSMSKEAATKEIVDFIQQGKEKELVDTALKMNFGSKYLDESGNPVNNENQSQDYAIKLNFVRLVLDIKDILTVNGANLTKDSLIRELGPKGTQEIRYGMLAALASEESNSISWYLNRYNELSAKLVKESLDLQELLRNKTDRQKRAEKEAEKEGEENSEVKEKQLRESIEQTKKELDKFKDGTMSDEFIQDAIFEMTSKISGVYIPATDIHRWIEQTKGKLFNELSDSERAELQKEFEASKPLRRDLMHWARLVHIKNMEWLSDMMTKYDETYFKDLEEIIKNFGKVFFGYRDFINQNPEEAVPIAESFIAIYKDAINPLLYRFLQAILETIDGDTSKLFSNKIKEILDRKTSMAERLGITIPTTAEEFLALDVESKRKLLTELGVTQNLTDPDFVAKDENYLKESDELDESGNKKLVLSEEFVSEIKNLDKSDREKQAADFAIQLIQFLSDKEIKLEIINKLKSAKYIIPQLKQAMTDFFNNQLKVSYIDDDGEEILLELDLRHVDDYLNAFKDIPSSPVDMYLHNVVTTLQGKGIEISPLVANLDELISKLSKAKNLESFLYDENVERIIDLALEIIQLAKAGLESASTVIEGDLSDAFGFNASINQIRAKRGTNNKKLAEINSDIAAGIIMDIERYEKELITFKTLFAYNSNSILNEHDKTYKVLSINLYNRLKNFVGHLEAGDWDDVDKLKKDLEDPEITEVFDGIEDKSMNLEFKLKLTKARLKIDKALYNFFNSEGNRGKIRNFKTEDDRNIAVKSLLKLLKDLNITYNESKEVNTVVNLEEESIPDKDFLWYLASMAAANPELVMYEYSDVLSELYAPIIGQEEAIRTTLSFLIDPKVFNLFADAYNANLIEKGQEDESFKKQISYLFVNAYRSIFIEGVPGSGKSTATLRTLIDILRRFHPDVLKKVTIVSNSKDNARTLTENLGFNLDETKHFGIEEFRGKIINNYELFETNPDGSLKLDSSDVEYDSKNKAYKYRNLTPNIDGLDTSFIIIDEATSLSLMDALLLDEFMKAKDIYGVYSGDFDQLGVSGSVEGTDKFGKPQRESITQDSTNYISTHKLGLVIRGNNKYKSENTIRLKTNKYNFVQSLMLNGKIDPINFSYYMDDNGVYGDVVVKADVKTDTEKTFILDEGTKNIIDTMVKSLKEGEKINYIYDDENSEMYKYIHENYADKVNEISTKAAQSLEGLYYIVDIEVLENLNPGASSTVKGFNIFKSLYTAISRAKQATLIYDRGTNAGAISKRLNSVRVNKLIKSEISIDSRKKYAQERKLSIRTALNGYTPKEGENDFNWKEETYSPPKKTTPSVEPEGVVNPDTDDKDTSDDAIDLRNLSREPDIVNEEEGKLNMMIHSFNANEPGGIIDDNTGELILGENGARYDNKNNKIVGARIDNANGIVRVINGGVTIQQDGRLSKSDTDKVLKALHEIRRAGLYGHTNDEIVSMIRKSLGLSDNQTVSARFIYKNRQSQLMGNNVNGNIKKFFRSIKEKLMYLFTGETNPAKKEELEKSNIRTFDLEIFVDGQQLDISLGTLTNPGTLVQTQGFLLLKAIYDTCNDNLIEFHKKLRAAKQANQKIPHLDSMLKLMEVYLWNYDGHYTNHQNFVVRFNKDFVLNSSTSKITGVQTPPVERGAHYKNKWQLYYKGKRLSLDEYRRLMPNRAISLIYENIDEDIKDVDGNVVLEKGIPFVLVSDYYQAGVSELELYKQYIEQITTKNSEPKITRIYLYLPTESLDYFLYNLQNALKNLGNSDDQNAEDLDTTIGNKLTTYRLMQFMMLDDSNFIKAFEEWVDNNASLSEEQKRKSKKRLHRVKDLVKTISDYENSLKSIYEADLKAGNKNLESVAKQMLGFLDTIVETVDKQHPELNIRKILYGETEDGMIGNTNFSLRTILLQEFRKLLFTELTYEEAYDENYPNDKPASPTLRSLNFYITKDTEGNYIYRPGLQSRIDALKEDAKRNKWTGVMFHSSLARESEIVVSKGKDKYRIARINAAQASFVSSKPIDINGKLDTTAVILDVEPILDHILANLVVTNDGSVCSSVIRNSGYSDLKKIEIYKENTGGFLSGIEPNIEPSKSEKLFRAITRDLDGEDVEKVRKLMLKFLFKNNIDFNPDDKDQVLEIIDNFFESLPEYDYYISGGKIKVVYLGKDAIKLTNILNETYYLKNNKIYRGSDKHEIKDYEELENILEEYIRLGLEKVISDYITKLKGTSGGNVNLGSYWSTVEEDQIEVGDGVKYPKAIATKPGTSPNTFNGEQINKIRDPQGQKIAGKFYTDQGSEYIISDAGRTRRIKTFHYNTGGSDAGLHNWMNHSLFVKNLKFGEAAYLFMDNGFEIALDRVDDNHVELKIKKKSTGEWITPDWSDVYPKAVEKGLMQDGDIITEISDAPIVGYYLIEWETHGQHFKRFHPGSQISHIEFYNTPYIHSAKKRIERSKLLNKESIIDVVYTNNFELQIEVDPAKNKIEGLDLNNDPNALILICENRSGKLEVIVLRTLEDIIPSKEEQNRIIDKYVPKELQNYINGNERKIEDQKSTELSNRLLEENPNITIDEIIAEQTKLPNKLRDEFGILLINGSNTNEIKEVTDEESEEAEKGQEILDKLFGENKYSFDDFVDFGFDFDENVRIKTFISGIKGAAKDADGKIKVKIGRYLLGYVAYKTNNRELLNEIRAVTPLDLGIETLLKKVLKENYSKELLEKLSKDLADRIKYIGDLQEDQYCEVIDI